MANNLVLCDRAATAPRAPLWARSSTRSAHPFRASFVAPRTNLERKLAGIWAEVLNLEQMGVNDPFLELGGDSLRATQVINRIRDKFHVEIPITVLFEAPTVAEMSAIIAQHLTPEGDPDSKERLSGEGESLFHSEISSRKTSKEI